MTFLRACASATSLALAIAGCSSSGSSPSGPPPGVTCGSTQDASDAASARSALSGAASGTCVVLQAGTYAGPFTVPPGALLVSSARATITGGSATEPAVTLGEGSTLAGVDVTGAAGTGVAIRGANATMSDVNVTGAQSAALTIKCEGASCLAGTVALKNVALEKSAMGLLASGAHVVMTGGRSAEHQSDALALGQGVVAQGGAKLELSGVTIEKNQAVGLLVDGVQTTAVVDGATVADNGERGVWIQKVIGSVDVPAVKITNSQLVRNRITGLGVVESRGIIIVGGRIGDTVASSVLTDLATTEDVGDGIGIFGESTDFKLQDSLVEANARAAGLVDKGSQAGIIIVGGKTSAGASGLKWVVQNTPDGAVQVADGDKSVPAKALGVSAPKLSVPPLL